jgi:RimJ/RimL family protein N-acetyltransferase
MNACHDLIPGTDLPRVNFSPVGFDHADMLHAWLSDDRVCCWLDFGGGRQQLTKLALYALLTSKRNLARLFHPAGDATPIGLVCMTDIDNPMGSSEVWGMRGLYGTAPKHIATSAMLTALATGFVDQGREVMGSWLVDGNAPSMQIHRKLGLTETGRQRARHRMHGRLHDRVLFDITREEFIQRFPDVPSETGRTCRSMGWLGTADQMLAAAA